MKFHLMVHHGATGTSDILGLVNIQKAIEHGHRNSGFSHEKW